MAYHAGCHALLPGLCRYRTQTVDVDSRGRKVGARECCGTGQLPASGCCVTRSAASVAVWRLLLQHELRRPKHDKALLTMQPGPTELKRLEIMGDHTCVHAVP